MLVGSAKQSICRKEKIVNLVLTSLILIIVLAVEIILDREAQGLVMA